LKILTENISTGVVKRAATKPRKRKRPEKMLMNSRPIARDAGIEGCAVALGGLAGAGLGAAGKIGYDLAK
jgi:hypothetical protein